MRSVLTISGRRSGFWLGLALGACLVAAAQVAIAAGDTIFSGCRNDATGAIRLLPSSLPSPFNTQCNTTANPVLHETPISWSQGGPAGAVGPTGATGATGARGATGPAGAKGDSGVNGAVGATGAAGPKGDTGAAGPAGTSGPAGASGPQGPAGATGASGPAGPAGELAGLDALAGRPCRTNLAAPGVLVVTYALDGAVSLRCDTPNAILTVTSSGSGTGGVWVGNYNFCTGTCDVGFAPGSSVTLTAQPDQNMKFKAWTGGCAGTSTTCTFVISASTTVNAEFDALPTATLTVSTSGTGAGKITRAGDLDCGSVCSHPYALGSSVTLTAVPDAWSNLASWSVAGCPNTSLTCTVVVNGDMAVSAVFSVGNLRVNIATDSICYARFDFSCDWFWGSASVTHKDAKGDVDLSCVMPEVRISGSNNTYSCLFFVADGQTMTFSATPLSVTETFFGWSGDCTGSGACTVEFKNKNQITIGATFRTPHLP